MPVILVLKGQERENPEDPASQNSVEKISRKTSLWQPLGVHTHAHMPVTHSNMHIHVHNSLKKITSI